MDKHSARKLSVVMENTGSSDSTADLLKGIDTAIEGSHQGDQGSDDPVDGFSQMYQGSPIIREGCMSLPGNLELNNFERRLLTYHVRQSLCQRGTCRRCRVVVCHVSEGDEMAYSRVRRIHIFLCNERSRWH